jgi:hypothetical protein
MKAFATILCAVAVIWLGYILWPLLDEAEAERREDRAYYLAERERLTLEREQWALEQEQAYAPLDNALWYLWGAGVLVLAVAVGYGAADHYARRRQLVYPNARGDLPVPYLDVLNGSLNTVAVELAEMRRAVELAAAARPNVPNVITYSPHIAPHYENRQQIEGQAAAALPPPAAVPSFAQLLASGRVGKGQPLLLGLDAETGGEIIGDWRDLYSTAVAGKPGSGKTTSVRFIAAQSAMHGGRFVVLDPHGDSGDDSLAGTLAPLASAFVCDPAIDERAMLAAVRLATDELRQRLRDAKRERTPLIVCVDEFSALMRGTLGEGLALLVEQIAQEGRKVQVFALLAGQVWTAERSGGTALRDSLASAYVHRLGRGQARMLLPTDIAPKAEGLNVGQVLLARTSGEVTTATIPLTTGQDLIDVGRRLTDTAPTMTRLVNDPVNGASMDDKPSVTAAERPTAQTARILALARAATPISKIVEEIYGVKGGPKYQERAAEVMRVIAEALATGGMQHAT